MAPPMSDERYPVTQPGLPTITAAGRTITAPTTTWLTRAEIAELEEAHQATHLIGTLDGMIAQTAWLADRLDTIADRLAEAIAAGFELAE